MNPEATNPYELSDDEFDALEELLTSDVVPEDCMDLEMLDGYFAAIIASPEPIASSRWLPGVWSAHGDAATFATGNRMQRVIALVLGYFNELATTIGTPEGWEPFCYAGAEADEIEIGEEWVEGFIQGLELWPEDWESRIPSVDAGAVRSMLAGMVAQWERANGDAVDDETRLRWLVEARDTVSGIVLRWRALELPAPELFTLGAAGAVMAGGPGRNDICPCGSGLKFKKCCGPA